MDSSQPEGGFYRVPWLDLTLGAGLLALLLAATNAVIGLPPLSTITALLLFLGLSALISLGLHLSRSRFGPADRVTLLRAVLVLFLASLTFFPEFLDRMAWPYALLCLVALLMDGADGYVARRTGTASDFGGRFDMELDAFFILILCIAVTVLEKAGPWVLLIGLMRYGFVGAGLILPWLNGPLPESFRRKTVCVWQPVTLMVAILPPTPHWFATATLLLALGLLVWSFATDVCYLHREAGTPLTH
ncbi:Phosphatidylglycerophosphate synthase [Marinobacter daqiaonensis]|uniref:Phosphatidylglycerophosphate synthase n=1 Tax=Marinobacter daqiaonensis TaxID=650891 RepID=A0A1I6H0B3_9GAMM|nr:CDP-alcohol phosphatidyltransferase family protein [Marinobacter daqiaonensis]SFR47909.1 Phosphatidylglycerophosphate synthase [Marinobacter daqiaonensis]